MSFPSQQERADSLSALSSRGRVETSQDSDLRKKTTYGVHDLLPCLSEERSVDEGRGDVLKDGSEGEGGRPDGREV